MIVIHSQGRVLFYKNKKLWRLVKKMNELLGTVTPSFLATVPDGPNLSTRSFTVDT